MSHAHMVTILRPLSRARYVVRHDEFCVSRATRAAERNGDTPRRHRPARSFPPAAFRVQRRTINALEMVRW